MTTDFHEKLVAATKDAKPRSKFDMIGTYVVGKDIKWEVKPYNSSDQASEDTPVFQNLAEASEHFVDNHKVLPGSTFRMNIEVN